MILKNFREYYIFQLKYNFFNFNYLCLWKNTSNQLENLCHRYCLHLFSLQSLLMKKLFFSKSYFSFNQSLLCFNDLAAFILFLNNWEKPAMKMFSWMGYFLNSRYLKNFSKYFNFYKKNYFLLTFFIATKINNFTRGTFFSIYKLINLLNQSFDGNHNVNKK